MVDIILFPNLVKAFKNNVRRQIPKLFENFEPSDQKRSKDVKNFGKICEVIFKLTFSKHIRSKQLLKSEDKK